MNKTNRDSVLQVREMRREFPTPTEPLIILNGVTFDLSPGQSMAVMGPSGSGKSTLLQILGTLDRPTSGTMTLGGIDPFKLSQKKQAAFRNEKIGFVFQDHYLLPQCNVLENVVVPTLVGRHKAREIEKRALSLLDRVGLSGRLDHRPAELSGGERQRVAIARAVINSPVLLLCDEPTGNLDRKSSESVGAIFKQLQEGENMMLVVVTHSTEFASIFDRKAELIDGLLTAG